MFKFLQRFFRNGLNKRKEAPSESETNLDLRGVPMNDSESRTAGDGEGVTEELGFVPFKKYFPGDFMYLDSSVTGTIGGIYKSNVAFIAGAEFNVSDWEFIRATSKYRGVWKRHDGYSKGDIVSVGGFLYISSGDIPKWSNLVLNGTGATFSIQHYRARVTASRNSCRRYPSTEDLLTTTDNKRGLLVFLDGIDLSGKTTQCKLLVDALESSGKKVKHYKYPNYSSAYGKLITAYLNGEYGDAGELHPMLAGSLFTLDRCLNKDEIKEYVKEGYIVIIDRSPYSNAAFQGSKGKDMQAQKEIFNWFVDTEFNGLSFPEPDLVLFMNNDPAVVNKMIANRSTDESVATDGKSDQHESNQDMLVNAHRLYKEESLTNPYWLTVDVMNSSSEYREVTAIHAEILKAVLIANALSKP